jgi:RND family efflux transporter MFP subunit
MSLVLSACSDSSAVETPTEKLLTVATAVAQESPNYSVMREYVGAVRANQKANLGFELAGKISDIYVDAGEQVKKGQPLIVLDTQLLKTEQKQLQAQLNEVNAQLTLTKTNLKRQHSLRKKGFSSEADIDSLNSQKDALIANVFRISSSIEGNQLKQKKSVIKAPYSGVIGSRFVSLGDVVSAGSPTLELISTDAKEAVIGVFKGDVQSIQRQELHRIRIDGQIVDANLISSPANIDVNSRNVRLRFGLEGSQDLLDGELAYLMYEKQFEQHGFWLPNSALTDGLRGTWNVYVLTQTDQTKKVENRSVQVLYSDSSRVFVAGALASGDEVVVSGLHKVVPGQAVQVAN